MNRIFQSLFVGLLITLSFNTSFGQVTDKRVCVSVDKKAFVSAGDVMRICFDRYAYQAWVKLANLENEVHVQFLGIEKMDVTLRPELLKKFKSQIGHLYRLSMTGPAHGSILYFALRDTVAYERFLRGSGEDRQNLLSYLAQGGLLVGLQNSVSNGIYKLPN